MTSQALAGGLSVTGRILVAVLLGYALAYAVTACLSIYLPLPRPDRVSFGSLGCFAVWVAAIVYAFAARSAWRACWVLASKENIRTRRRNPIPTWKNWMSSLRSSILFHSEWLASYWMLL